MIRLQDSFKLGIYLRLKAKKPVMSGFGNICKNACLDRSKEHQQWEKECSKTTQCAKDCGPQILVRPLTCKNASFYTAQSQILTFLPQFFEFLQLKNQVNQLNMETKFWNWYFWLWRPQSLTHRVEKVKNVEKLEKCKTVLSKPLLHFAFVDKDEWNRATYFTKSCSRRKCFPEKLCSR